MTRRILGLAAAMLAALALAACNSVPNSGPVREGLSSLDQVERAYMFNPSRPTPGAEKEAIVRGFVRAAASSDRDYEVAREYLAPKYNTQWDPSLGVLVVEGSQQVQLLQDDIAVLSLHAVASIDARGTMTLSEPGNQSEVQFELTKVKGEWRISSAPAGIILDRPTFTAVWTQRSLFFLSQDGRLVADPRWFLNRPTLATQVVRGLIEGPSDAMSQVLHTELPAGTALTSGSVPVDDGVAEIDLSAELLEANEASMDRIRRQLVASLQGVPGVSGYALSVHGSMVSTGPVVGTPEAGTSVVVMRDGVFGVVSEGEVKPIPGLSERVAELAPWAASISNDRTSALVLHRGGVSYVNETSRELIDERQGLLTPSLDPLGYAWLYDPTRPGEVTVDATPIASGGGRESHTLEVPWLANERAVAVRVSMGGSRLAALVQSDGGSVVLVAGILRDAEGTPTGLVDTAIAEMWESGEPIDLDWVGDTRFAALTKTGLLGNSSRVTNGVVGQFSSERGAVSGGSAISGGGSWAQQLRVLDDQHRMFSPQGVGWQQVLTDVDFIAKVG